MSTPDEREWVDQTQTWQEVTARSCLRAFKHHGLGLQVRRGCPAGQCPRSRLRRWGVVRAVVRLPPLIDASRVRQREAEEVFDLRERQDHRVRVSMVQVLVQRLIFARHYWSFRSKRWPTAHTPRRIIILSERHHIDGRCHARPRETVSSAQFARWNCVERLLENLDG
jgi:hypothetical protein